MQFAKDKPEVDLFIKNVCFFTIFLYKILLYIYTIHEKAYKNPGCFVGSTYLNSLIVLLLNIEREYSVLRSNLGKK